MVRSTKHSVRHWYAVFCLYTSRLPGWWRRNRWSLPFRPVPNVRCWCGILFPVVHHICCWWSYPPSFSRRCCAWSVHPAIELWFPVLSVSSLHSDWWLRAVSLVRSFSHLSIEPFPLPDSGWWHMYTVRQTYCSPKTNRGISSNPPSRQTALLPDRHFSMLSWPHPYLP